MIRQSADRNLDGYQLVSSSINELIRFGFLGKISQRRQGTIYEVIDQRIALAEIIVKRISSSKEPQGYLPLFDSV